MSKTSCFNPRGIELIDPFYDWKGDRVFEISVPCGKCENCIRRRRAEWSFRMEEELRHCKVAYFVTLTYEKVKRDQWGNMTLCPEDLTRYWKRLRIDSERNYKYIKKGYRTDRKTKEKIPCYPTYENLFNGLNDTDVFKYYACGEYGEKFGRPHYHAIVFNMSKKFIIESWKHGYVDVRKAEQGSIAYVTKYLDKWRNQKQDWKKVKEFNVQSEGLGESYTKRMQSFFRSNLDINYCVNDRGLKIPMPRYYRLKMLNDDELMQQRAIIHNAVEQEKEKRIYKLGLEEFNRRELDRQTFVKRLFTKESKSRRDL